MKDESASDSHHGTGGHDHHDEVKENPMIVVPLVLTAFISLVIGVYPNYFLSLAQEVIR